MRLQSPNNTGKRIAILLLTVFAVLLFLSQFAYAQDPANQNALPTGKDDNILFFLQGDQEANTLVYKLNFDDTGKLHPDTPIKGFWITNRRKQKFKETHLTEDYPYEVKSKPIGNEAYEIRLLAFKEIPLYLKRSQIDNKYHLYIEDEGNSLLLKRVFVKLDSGTVGFPKIRHIDLITTNSITGLEILKRIKT